MYHSITFGDKNTWDDWKLIPEVRPLFSPPDVKTSYVDIPGSDGIKDMTESLTGEPLYSNRQGSIIFFVMNGYKEWQERYSEIMNYLHGQKMIAILEDDPSYYYEGRFSVDEWNSSKDYSKIAISYDVYPYKIDSISSADDWLWDSFNFDNGIIREYSKIIINGSKTIEMYGSRRSSIPSFDVTLDDPTKPIELYWSKLPNQNFYLVNGDNKIPDIKVKNGVSNFTFTGNGVVSINYRGGSL